MRAAVLAALALAASSTAQADTMKPSVVWNNRVIPSDRTPGAVPLTTVSHTLYLNNCLPNGCTVTPGNDNSLTNQSSIPNALARLDAWSWGDDHWNALVACVKETFLPFQIDVVTTDPGTANHFEVMIGGFSTQLDPQLSAGGVAPFIGCGATRANAISFVFAGQTSGLDYLCAAVAQEACHIWGLDHELDAKDPMTYLDLGSSKRFQLADAQCGEELASPRRCRCGANTQNSFQYMKDTFGAADLPEATLALQTPSEGAWVRPGFPIRALLTSVLGARDASFSIDDTPISTLTQGPFAWNAPPSITGGDHTVTVRGSDSGGRMAMTSVSVHVTPACSAAMPCANSLNCLGGFCLPGANVDGGLGATCTTNEACITGSCGSNGDEQRCTGTCDEGQTCPAGFDCLGASTGGGVCWPSPDGGGCAASGPGSPAPVFMLAGLGVLAIVVRKRRR
jgi:uncharacterized protein (TIGR03382 family)